VVICQSIKQLIVLSDVQSCGQSIVEEVLVYIFSGAYCILFMVMYMFVLRLA